MQEDAAIVAVLPDGPPVLDGGGFRALLGMLTSAAESEAGSRVAGAPHRLQGGGDVTADPKDCTVTLEDLRAGDLSTDELAHLLANRRAREANGPPPPMEWEQRERTVEDRAYRFVQWARSIGAEDDQIGSSLTTKLRRLGYSNDSATDVLRDVGIAWHSRSAEERLIAVASEMLAEGWDEPQVRWAIDGLVPGGH